MAMTTELKQKIDAMSVEDMLRKSRFAPLGDPLFTGESGEYFFRAMNKKKDALPEGDWSRISKCVGWN